LAENKNVSFKLTHGFLFFKNILTPWHAPLSPLVTSETSYSLSNFIILFLTALLPRAEEVALFHCGRISVGSAGFVFKERVV